MHVSLPVTVLCLTDDAIALAKYADLTTGEEVIEFIEPYLAKRPVKVELHRLYQDLMEKLTRITIWLANMRIICGRTG